jgi:hypothetical protein
MDEHERRKFVLGIHRALDQFGPEVVEQALAFSATLPADLPVVGAAARVAEFSKGAVERKLTKLASELARLKGERAALSIMAVMFPNGPVGSN